MNRKTKLISSKLLVTNSIRSDEAGEMAQLALQRLSDNIGIQGIQTPLSVCLRNDGKYLIAAGNRRFEAGKKFGFRDFPCLVYPMKYFDNIRIGENVIREDLKPSQIANYTKKIMEKTNKTLKEVSKITGVSYDTLRKQSYISQLLLEFQEMIDVGVMSVRAGSFISALNNEGQHKLLRLVKNLDLKKIPRTVIRSLTDDFSSNLFKTEKRQRIKDGWESTGAKRVKEKLKSSFSVKEKDLANLIERKNYILNDLEPLLSLFKRANSIPVVKEHLKRNHKQEIARVNEVLKVMHIDVN